MASEAGVWGRSEPWADGTHTTHAELTRRQVQVARLLPAGLPAREIAERLMVSEGTVRKHVRELIERTGARNAQAVSAWAALHWDCCLRLPATNQLPAAPFEGARSSQARARGGVADLPG